MAEMCKFPLCKRIAEKNGYCVGHRIYADSQTINPVKTVEKRSPKQKEVIKELKKLYKIYLNKPGNQKCKIKSPVCTVHAETINHKKRRGANVLNQKDWQPCCSACNSYIENFPEWAYEKGHLVKVHQKSNP